MRRCRREHLIKKGFSRRRSAPDTRGNAWLFGCPILCRGNYGRTRHDLARAHLSKRFFFPLLSPGHGSRLPRDGNTPPRCIPPLHLLVICPRAVSLYRPCFDYIRRRGILGEYRERVWKKRSAAASRYSGRPKNHSRFAVVSSKRVGELKKRFYRLDAADCTQADRAILAVSLSIGSNEI